MAAAAPTITSPPADAASSPSLDPAVAAFLDKLAALPVVDPATVSVPVRRALFGSFAGTHAGELVAVRRIDDVQVPLRRAGGSRALRFYIPSSAFASDAAVPLLLYAHGGGWHAGSITTHEAICRRLANASEAVIASLDYRMAPESPAPAAVHDVLDAYAELVAFARGVRTGAATGTAAVDALAALSLPCAIDETRIGLAGDSAGANIVTAAALQLCSASSDLALPRPVALALIYPSLDVTAAFAPGVLDGSAVTSSYVRFAERHYIRTVGIRHYVRIYLGQAEAGDAADRAPTVDPCDPLVSPLFAPKEALACLPPTAIFTASHDPLLDDGARMSEALADAGVRCHYRCFPGFIHAWMHLIATVPAVAPALAEMGAAIGKLLRGEAPA